MIEQLRQQLAGLEKGSALWLYTRIRLTELEHRQAEANRLAAIKRGRMK